MKNFNLKAIIITLFIAVCLTACFVIAHPVSQTVSSEQETALVKSFLSRHGMNADNVIISAQPKIYKASANNMLEDKSLFAEKLFNGTAALSGDGNEYTFGSDKLTFSGPSFAYSAKSLPNKDELNGINTENAGKKTEEIAELHGLDLAGSVISFTEENGVYTSVITKTLNGLPIFNDSMTLTMSADGLHSIKGVWFSVSAEEKRAAKSASSALIHLINDPECPKSGAEIAEMEPGYVLTDPSLNKTELKPVWRITLSDEKVFYVDA